MESLEDFMDMDALALARSELNCVKKLFQLSAFNCIEAL